MIFDLNEPISDRYILLPEDSVETDDRSTYDITVKVHPEDEIVVQETDDGDLSFTVRGISIVFNPHDGELLANGILEMGLVERRFIMLKAWSQLQFMEDMVRLKQMSPPELDAEIAAVAAKISRYPFTPKGDSETPLVQSRDYDGGLG